MSNRLVCRVCGRPLHDVDADGLCSGRSPGRSPGRWGFRPTCFAQFLGWAERVKGLDVGSNDPRGPMVVDWSRPEVQIAFDEWVALQPPAVNTHKGSPSRPA